MMRILIPLLAVTVLLLPACGEPEPDTSGSAHAIPHIYTTFYPTTYFTRRIVGDRAEVICPLPPDEDPVFWQPAAKVIGLYQNDADLIVVNGAGMEKWVRVTSLPEEKLCDTLEGHKDRFLQYLHPVKHSHGGKVHVHQNTDGHTWMDPTLALIQAQAIHAALVKRYPSEKEAFDRGLAGLRTDLESLDAAFRALGAQPDGQWIYAAHPAYAYPAKAYGWRIEVVTLEPEVEPTEAQLSALAKSLEGKPGKFLWWEAPPLEATVVAIRKRTGIESIVFSPGETPPAQGDYLSLMQANLRRARAAFAAGD